MDIGWKKDKALRVFIIENRIAVYLVATLLENSKCGFIVIDYGVINLSTVERIKTTLS